MKKIILSLIALTFFLSFASASVTNSYVNSTYGLNTATENLNCWATGINYENLNYSIDWYRNGNPFVREIWNKTDLVGDGWDIVLDSSNNVYTIGHSPINHSGNVNYDLAIIKYDKDGTYIWNKTYNFGLGNENIIGGAIDNLDNIYATGSTIINHTGRIDTDELVVKLDSDGNLLWNVTYDNGYGADSGYKISTDLNNNVYVGGYGINNNSNNDALLREYNSTGDYLWNITYDSGYGDYAFDVKVDSLGNIYSIIVNNQYGTYDSILFKYNSTKDTIWNKTYNAGSDDITNRMSINIYNDLIYLTGSINVTSRGDIDWLILKYNNNGNLIWNKTYDGGFFKSEVSYSNTIDLFGNLYVTGHLRNNASNYDGRVIKINSNGDLIWSQTYGNGANDGFIGITIDDLSNLYISGETMIEGAYHFLTIKYKDGALLTNQVSGQQVLADIMDSSYISSGDTWSCNIKDYNTTWYGSSLMSNSVLILNNTNYVVTNCLVQALQGSPYYSTNFNASYSYSYLGNSASGDAASKSITSFLTYPTLIGLIGTIVLLGAVIGVLVISFSGRTKKA
jgi:hypothetical protein